MITANTVVNKVSYKNWTPKWYDSKEKVEKVLVIVHIPSGQWKNDYHVKVTEDGTSLSITERTPALFKDTNFVELQAGIDSNHVKTQAFRQMINDEQDLVDPMQDPCNLMMVDLPIVCEKQTMQRVNSHKDVDMADCDDAEKNDLINLLYIELIGVEKKYSVGSATSPWRGEIYSDSSDPDSDPDSEDEDTPVAGHAKTVKTHTFTKIPGKGKLMPTARSTKGKGTKAKMTKKDEEVDSADFSYVPVRSTASTASDITGTKSTNSSTRFFVSRLIGYFYSDEPAALPAEVDLHEDTNKKEGGSLCGMDELE